MGLSSAFLILGLILVIWVYYWCFNHPDVDSVRLDDLISGTKFKTGDLILFKAVDNFNPVFIMSYYGHIGIIHVDPDTNVPHIFEAANPAEMALNPDQNSAGIFVSPVESRIKTYKGIAYHKPLERVLGPDICREFKNFMDFCVKNMEYNANVISNGLRKAAGEKIGTKVNCGELAFLSLIKLGLIPLEYYDKKCAHHLRWMCKIVDLTNNKYGDPVKITYSPIEDAPNHIDMC